MFADIRSLFASGRFSISTSDLASTPGNGLRREICVHLDGCLKSPTVFAKRRGQISQIDQFHGATEVPQAIKVTRTVYVGNLAFCTREDGRWGMVQCGLAFCVLSNKAIGIILPLSR